MNPKKSYKYLKTEQLKIKYRQMIEKHTQIAEHLFVRMLELDKTYMVHKDKCLEYKRMLKDLEN